MELTQEQWAAVRELTPEPLRRADWRGRPWRDSREVLEGIVWALRSGARWKDLPPLRPLEDFHRDPRYGGDLHRADMAGARPAADLGLSAAEIRAALMQARDLSKKGDLKRQREYAARTADKAVRQTESRAHR